MYAESYSLAMLDNRDVDKDISSMRAGRDIDKDAPSMWKDIDIDKYSFGRWKLNPREVWDRLERLGLSQNDLARQAGVSSGYLSRLMNGTRCPSARTCHRLEEALGCQGFDGLFIRVLRERAVQRTQEAHATSDGKMEGAA